jgi:hypothetical protein
MVLPGLTIMPLGVQASILTSLFKMIAILRTAVSQAARNTRRTDKLERVVDRVPDRSVGFLF